MQAIESKLPSVGTTIFTVMSALATEHNAVNLGQGFPDFNCDPALIAQVANAMGRGLNQYPPMPGVLALREAGGGQDRDHVRPRLLAGQRGSPSPPVPPRPS